MLSLSKHYPEIAELVEVASVASFAYCCLCRFTAPAPGCRCSQEAAQLCFSLRLLPEGLDWFKTPFWTTAEQDKACCPRPSRPFPADAPSAASPADMSRCGAYHDRFIASSSTRTGRTRRAGS